MRHRRAAEIRNWCRARRPWPSSSCRYRRHSRPGRSGCRRPPPRATESSSPRLAHLGAGGHEALKRGGDVLIAGVELFLEPVELRVAEGLPPPALERSGLRLRGAPRAGGRAPIGARCVLLEGARRGDARALVRYADTAGKPRQSPDEGDRGGAITKALQRRMPRVHCVTFPGIRAAAGPSTDR
jgi:hypothetical protein